MTIEHDASSKANAVSETNVPVQPDVAAASETASETAAASATETAPASEAESAAADVPARRLALPVQGSLRNGLLVAFTEILARAGQQAPGSDPAALLHEHRKALRRARALLRLMQDMVGAEAYGVLTSTLRELHRATSPLRDRHVVQEVLDGIVRDNDLDEATAAAAAQLRAALASMPAPDMDTITELLADGAARMGSLPRRLDGGLPGRIKWYAVADGLGATYQRARRALRAAKRTGADETVHGLRKRLKELTYQVELLAGVAGKRSRKTRKRLSRVAHDLGEVVDLMVLRGYVDEHVEPGDARDRLAALVEDARARRLSRALARTGKLLDDDHDDFARKLTRDARKGRKAAR